MSQRENKLLRIIGYFFWGGGGTTAYEITNKNMVVQPSIKDLGLNNNETMSSELW